jgi:small nuclear ribonucleoprotein (snRNP)-like protein
MEFLKTLLQEPVKIKCKEGNSLQGTLCAFDPHLNIVLSDVTEIKKSESKCFREALFVRGDCVILVAPLD